MTIDETMMTFVTCDDGTSPQCDEMRRYQTDAVGARHIVATSKDWVVEGGGEEHYCAPCAARRREQAEVKEVSV